MMVRSVISLDHLLAQSPTDAAAFWLVRQDLGESAADAAIFQKWLEADPAHGEAWARACSLWEGVAAADPEDVAELRETAPVRHWWRDWRSAAAASVAAIAIGYGAYHMALEIPRRSFPQIAARADRASAAQVLATVAGERHTFILGDRSVATLNTNTTLLVHFEVGTRRVKLVRGQAYFEVAHDAARPFIVENDGRTVTATGTRFDVQTVNESMRVILFDGRVRVVAPVSGMPKAINLQAGEQLVADRAGINVEAADVASATDWRNGLVSFHDTPLSQAVLELNRYATGKHLLIRDRTVAAIRISGSFHTDDLPRFARTIAEIYPVRILESANTIELIPRHRAYR